LIIIDTNTLVWIDNNSQKGESIAETTVDLNDGSRVRVNLLKYSGGNIKIVDAMLLVEDGKHTYSESFPWSQISLK